MLSETSQEIPHVVYRLYELSKQKQCWLVCHRLGRGAWGLGEWKVIATGYEIFFEVIKIFYN